MTALQFVTLLLFMVNFNNSNCLRSFDIRWRSINCSMIAKSYFDHFNCSLHEWPRNRGNYISADMQFVEDIKSVLLDFAVYLPGQRRNIVIKFRSDGCHMSKYQTINPMISAFFKQMYQCSNFPRNCPLKANVPYNIKGLSLNPDYFPGNTPDMKFSIKLNMFSVKVHVLSALLEANVARKNRQQVKKVN